VQKFHGARFAGKTIAVLGAGHSAIGTLTDLTTLARQAPGTNVVWLLRSNDPAKAFGGGANDKLVARGELGAHFASLVASGQVKVEAGFPVTHFTSTGDRLRVASGSGCCGRHVVVDELFVGPQDSVRIGRSCARCVCAWIRRSRRPSRWRR
jgi:hypothetical protein